MEISKFKDSPNLKSKKYLNQKYYYLEAKKKALLQPDSFSFLIPEFHVGDQEVNEGNFLLKLTLTKRKKISSKE